MTSVDIYGANYSGHSVHTRAASRGLVLQDDRLLLSHGTLTDLYMLPGGGVEEGETPEQACIRELGEETGVLVQPGECFLTIHEYYEDWHYISWYYLCTPVGTVDRKPTPGELRIGLTPEWLPLRQACDIFSHHADWTGIEEERRGLYQREYTALQAWMAQQAVQYTAEHHGWIDSQLTAMPGVTKDYKAEWGWERYMVDGKLFAALCHDDAGRLTLITLKLPPLESDLLRQQYPDITPGYYMNKVHWSSIRADGAVPQPVVSELLDHAYRCLVSGFSKKRQRELLPEA